MIDKIKAQAMHYWTDHKGSVNSCYYITGY